MSSCALRRGGNHEDALFERLARYPCVRLECGGQIPPVLHEDTHRSMIPLKIGEQIFHLYDDTPIAQLCQKILLWVAIPDPIMLKSCLLIDGIPLASSSPASDTLAFLNLAQNPSIRLTLFTPSNIEIEGKPSPAVIKEMLRLEVRHRTSKYILAEMGKRVDGGQEDWMPLVEPLVQLPIVRAFGFDTPQQERIALMYLRSAAVIWPEDSDFRTIPYWIRANRARDASFKVGDLAPPVEVHPLNRDGSYGRKVPLIHPGKLQILLAGSIT